MNSKYRLRIGWIYPEFMSIYGDRGNIISLRERCQSRGIRAEIKNLELGFKKEELERCDILMMGGAQDVQQQIVEQDLLKKRGELKKAVDDGKPCLFVCGAYQSLGRYYKDSHGRIIKGLEILDLHTVNYGESHKRLIGNLAAKISFNTSFRLKTLVGFENHGGRTYLGKQVKPLAYVLVGGGNNGEDKTEGAFYRNSIGTYMHGPILPKNPQLADFLILEAMKRKYDVKNISKLDDTEELLAHEAIAKRMGIEI